MIETNPTMPEVLPCDIMTGLVTIQMQHLNRVYDVEAAFQKGTLFPELDKPWMMMGGRHR